MDSCVIKRALYYDGHGHICKICETLMPYFNETLLCLAYLKYSIILCISSVHLHINLLQTVLLYNNPQWAGVI